MSSASCAPSLCRARLLLGERREAQIRLDNLEVGEELLGQLVVDRRVHDDVVARHPVDGRRDAVLVARLERVDHAQHLGRVAARGRRVRQDEPDRLLGVDDEDGADREGDTLGVDVGRVLVVEPSMPLALPCLGRLHGVHLHVVQVRDLALLVANDGEVQLAARDLVDVLDPALMAVDGVGREADELDTALGELGLELGEGAELGGAHGRVVLGVREEHDPIVADELVEVDGALGGLGLEVGGNAAETEGLSALFGHVAVLVRGQKCKQVKQEG